MALGSCYTCIKYLMFTFNLIFWLIGCCIIGVGIWVLVDDDIGNYVQGADDFASLHMVAYIFIAIGVIIMVCGFCGCCGAIRESQCMLGFFFAFLFIIFVVLLGAGIWAIVAKDSMRVLVSDVLTDKTRASCENDQKARDFMVMVQTHFQCCGVNSVKDYDKTHCVHRPDTPCEATDIEVGCNDKLYDFFARHIMIVAGVAIGFAILLILGMIFSMILLCAIRDVQSV